jgi:hypothetical protein
MTVTHTSEDCWAGPVDQSLTGADLALTNKYKIVERICLDILAVMVGLKGRHRTKQAVSL